MKTPQFVVVQCNGKFFEVEMPKGNPRFVRFVYHFTSGGGPLIDLEKITAEADGRHTHEAESGQ